MSKAKLKKELQTLDRDQLIEVLLSTYSASAGAKEYLEFFLEPDVDKLQEKKLKLVDKELARSKYGYSKARVSVINKTIKDFESYGISPEYVATFALNIFVLMLRYERYLNYSATQVSTTGKILAKYILESTKAGQLKDALESLKTIYWDSKIGREAFKSYMPSWIRTAISALPEDTELPQVDFSK